MKFNKIFFDLDGPLLDVSDRYYQVYKNFCEKNRIDYLDKKSYWDKKRSRTLINIPPDIQKAFKKHWWHNIESRAYMKYDQVHDYVYETLECMAFKNIFILVTLRQNRRLLMEELEHFELLPYFHKIVSATPRAFRPEENWLIKKNLADELAHDGGTIVGDTETDILCGKVLNLKTIGVLNGISDLTVMKSFDPDIIIDNVIDLKKFI